MTTVIHVLPARGRWAVREDDAPRPVSVHATATEAELAACQRAREAGIAAITIHDLYMRVRDTEVSSGIRL